MTNTSQLQSYLAQMHVCLSDGTCVVIDQGLARCEKTTNYCTDTLCPCGAEEKI